MQNYRVYKRKHRKKNLYDLVFDVSFLDTASKTHNPWKKKLIELCERYC